jgi:protein-S-isoprenylcysteine O-methyltransferase Ste14
VETGRWLFRWRGVLPFLLVLVVLVSLQHFTYPKGSHTLDTVWEIGCLAVSGLGYAVRFLVGGYATKGTSGRNRRSQVADTLNTKGIYSVVRHPLYLGNFFISLGVSLLLRIWWFSTIFVLLYGLYVERIMFAEEDFLTKKFGQVYFDWADRTPAFLPTKIRWERPDVPFSIRNAIRREYRTLCGTLLAMFAMQVVAGYYLYGRVGFGRLWVAILICALAFWTVIRILDKKTRLLRVEGR